MALNKQNLKPISSKDEARRLGQKGGRASAQARREKKLLRETLETLLATEKDGQTLQEKISVSLVKRALAGDTKAFEVIRDTIGQKPTDKMELSGDPENPIQHDMTVSAATESFLKRLQGTSEA